MTRGPGYHLGGETLNTYLKNASEVRSDIGHKKTDESKEQSLSKYKMIFQNQNK